MIKEDILNMLKELNFPIDEFYIVGGSSLVMRGIREIAGDLDLCISTELFNIIKDNKWYSIILIMLITLIVNILSDIFVFKIFITNAISRKKTTFNNNVDVYSISNKAPNIITNV